jgi:hypothetical protein
MSGADVTDAERYRLVARAFRAIGTGTPVETAIDTLRREWLAFCDEMAAKIKAAPKIRSGPSAGLSVIHHRYAGPSAIEDNVIFIRNILGNSDAPTILPLPVPAGDGDAPRAA